MLSFTAGRKENLIMIHGYGLRRRLHFSLVITSLILVACSPNIAVVCNDPLGCIVLQPGEAVRLAYLLNISGTTQQLSQDILGGITLAIHDVQDQILGHPVDLSGVDTGCSTNEQQTGATQVSLIPQIAAVLGPACPVNFEPAVLTLVNAGLSVISMAVIPPHLKLTPTDSNSIPGFYRLASDPNWQGQVMGRFAYAKIHATNAGTIYDDSLYSSTLNRSFIDAFTAQGGTIAFQAKIQTFDELAAILDSIVSPPDVLYFPLFEGLGDEIVLQVRKLPVLSDVILLSSDSLLVKSFVTNTGSAAEHVYLTGINVDASNYQEFLSKWLVLNQQPPDSTYAIYAYDATHLMIDAILKTARSNANGTLNIRRQALRDFLAVTQDYPGISGRVNCSPAGDCITGQSMVVYAITSDEIKDGNWPPPIVWQIENR
jgi:branched-chain amino acid transport system substrate-binding protein